MTRATKATRVAGAAVAHAVPKAATQMAAKTVTNALKENLAGGRPTTTAWPARNGSYKGVGTAIRT